MEMRGEMREMREMREGKSETTSEGVKVFERGRGIGMERNGEGWRGMEGEEGGG